MSTVINDVFFKPVAVKESGQLRTMSRVAAMLTGLMALLSRVDIRPDRVEITIRRGFLVQLLCAVQSVELGMQGGKPSAASHDILTLTVKARLQRVGRETKMLVENSHDQTNPDPGLLRIVARAHDIQARLTQDTS